MTNKLELKIVNVLNVVKKTEQLLLLYSLQYPAVLWFLTFEQVFTARVVSWLKAF